MACPRRRSRQRGVDRDRPPLQRRHDPAGQKVDAYTMIPPQRQLILALLAVLLPSGAAAQNLRDVLPPQLQRQPGADPAAPAPLPAAPAVSPDGAAVLLPILSGLIFVPEIARIQPAGTDTPGLTILDLPPLDATFRAEMDDLIGQPLTEARLNAITQAVIRAYRRADRPLVDAIIPEQDVSSGVVQVAVIEFTVGEIRTEQNSWFSGELLRSYLRLQPGDIVRASAVAEDLALLNTNPFRRVELFYERGRAFGQTDLVLRAPDRLPLRIYGGFDDSGSKSLGTNRLFAGFGYGNLFGLDHQIGYQFTASTDLLFDRRDIPGRPDGPRFAAHSLAYAIPLPWRDRLQLAALYAETSPWLAETFAQQGFTTQISARYVTQLPRSEEFGQELRLGYDFKRTNNNLAFGGSSVSDNATEIHQMVADYSATVLDERGSTSATLTGVISPGFLSSANDRGAFEASRAGASPRYAYSLLQAERSTRLPQEFTLVLRATGQLASGALLASEQIGLGGATTIRGFENFAVSGDQGYILGAELRAPPSGLLHHLGYADTDRFQPLLFVESGRVWSRTEQTNGRTSTPLSSVGAGIRYTIDRYLSLRFDVGVQLNDPPDGSPRGTRSHISLIASW
jgi:hemolysin activation/secretion protein